MKIAIPLAEGKLALHFGHCPAFAVMDVDVATGKIVQREDISAPPHEPGLLPRWLAERGIAKVIAGGMGKRAVDLFAAQKIQVVLGAPPDTPENIVAAHLAGTLKTGENICDH